jgi:ribosomal-protein-alanine N-acetyltransferase
MTTKSADIWSLRRAAHHDAAGLHSLFCVPEVYRYLADGEPPPRAVVDDWLEQSDADFRAFGIGLWVLEDGRGALAGCVRLATQSQARSAELTYVLHPRHWGAGVATRMSWTVMQEAFRHGGIDRITAGADEPNTASVAVMRRLGMTFLRPVRYPLGAGVEYVFRRGDPPPAPIPEAIPLRKRG